MQEQNVHLALRGESKCGQTFEITVIEHWRVTVCVKLHEIHEDLWKKSIPEKWDANFGDNSDWPLRVRYQVVLNKAISLAKEFKLLLEEGKYNEFSKSSWRYKNRFKIIELPKDCAKNPSRYLIYGDIIQTSDKHEGIYVGNGEVVHMCKVMKDVEHVKKTSLYPGFVSKTSDVISVKIFRLRYSSPLQLSITANQCARKIYRTDQYDLLKINSQSLVSLIGFGFKEQSVKKKITALNAIEREEILAICDSTPQETKPLNTIDLVKNVAASLARVPNAAGHVILKSKFGHSFAANIPIPVNDVSLIQVLNNFSDGLDTMKSIFLPIAIMLNLAQLSFAMRKDYKSADQRPRETIKATASICASWGGAIAGGWAGGKTGIIFGTLIGSIFGGAGAVPGAAIGGFIGGLIGAMGTSFGASITAQHFAGKLNNKLFSHALEERNYLSNRDQILYMSITSTNVNVRYVAEGEDDDGTATLTHKEQATSVESFLHNLSTEDKESVKILFFNDERNGPDNVSVDENLVLTFTRTFGWEVACLPLNNDLLLAASVMNASPFDGEEGQTILVIGVNEDNMRVLDINLLLNTFEIISERNILFDNQQVNENHRANILGNENPLIVLSVKMQSTPLCNMLMDSLRNVMRGRFPLFMNQPKNIEHYISGALVSLAKIFEQPIRVQDVIEDGNIFNNDFQLALRQALVVNV